MGRRICLGVLALCMVIGGFAQAARKITEGRAWNVKDIPMPHLMDASRYVSNPDRIITSQTEKALNGMLKDLDAKTNSMHDLLNDNAFLYRWNGSQYEEWIWNGRELVKK